MQLDQLQRVFQIFCPSVPTRDISRLFGRHAECIEISRTLLAPGRHLVVYGERGVGKTSVSSLAARAHASARGLRYVEYQCGTRDTHLDIFRHVLREAGTLVDERPKSSAYERNLSATAKIPFAEGGGSTKRSEQSEFAAAIPDGVTPNEICRRLSETGLIVLLDEFDRVSDSGTRQFITETIKALSNTGGESRFIFCGVAMKSTDLIGEHASMARSLKSLRIRYLPEAALRQIIDNGTAMLKLEFSPALRNAIILMSCGLPYFTHLLCEELAVLAHKEQIYALDLKHLPPATGSALSAVAEATHEQYRMFVSPCLPMVDFATGMNSRDNTPECVRRLLLHAAALVDDRHCTPEHVSEKYRQLAQVGALLIPEEYRGLDEASVEIEVNVDNSPEPFLRQDGERLRFQTPFHRAYALLVAVSEIQVSGLPLVPLPMATDA